MNRTMTPHDGECRRMEGRVPMDRVSAAVVKAGAACAGRREADAPLPEAVTRKLVGCIPQSGRRDQNLTATSTIVRTTSATTTAA